MFESIKPYPWLKAIAAFSGEKRIISKEGKIPWKYPDEYKFFLDTISGHECVLGRVTWEYDKNLPSNKIYVLSRTIKNNKDKNVIFLNNFKELPKPEEGKIMWVCGGSEIFKLYLPFCSELIITHIHGNWKGDGFFPEYEHLFEFKKIIVEKPEYITKLYGRKK